MRVLMEKIRVVRGLRRNRWHVGAVYVEVFAWSLMMMLVRGMLMVGSGRGSCLAA